MTYEDKIVNYFSHFIGVSSGIGSAVRHVPRSSGK